MALFWSVVVVAADARAAVVEGVRLWRAPDHTRLVFDLSGPVDHKVFALKKPDRIVVDIDKSKFQASLASLDFDQTSIEKMRYGKRNQDDLRVVLDMLKTTQPRSFVLKRHAGKPDRLVIDIYGEGTKTQKTVAKVQPNVGSKKDILIAIDAGHGGEDPGSIGPGGIYEKTVVLKISKALKAIIDREPGFKAKLIRNADYYVENTLRRQKAREMRADLFVSIHSDGFTDPRAKGASVFALSRRGATSQMARILASKANESDLIGGAGSVSLSDKDDILAGVLVDLSMTATLASSLDVGGRVLKNMGGFTSLHKKHVEQAAFIVLKSPDVPSILVETGFITNPKESKKLKSASHQKRLANAVFSGIKSYFYDNPPEGTYVAWKKSGGKAAGKRFSAAQSHTISAGDTLSSIAKKYKISVNKLKSQNKLTSSTIRIGQVLTIPAS